MVHAESLLGRLAAAARPERPWWRITVSPWWARTLIAAGARPAPAVDAATSTPHQPPPGPTGDVPGSSGDDPDAAGAEGSAPGAGTSTAAEEAGDAAAVRDQLAAPLPIRPQTSGAGLPDTLDTRHELADRAAAAARNPTPATQRPTTTDPTGWSSQPQRPPRVFISDAHSSPAHLPAVRELWQSLRLHGIDARLDLRAAEQPQDWALWVLEQIRDADYVLVIVSPAYRRSAEGLASPDERRGAAFEASLFREAFYADPVEARRKYLPVLLADARAVDIPAFLGPASATHYRIGEHPADDAEPLLRVLIGQTPQPRPDVGAADPLAAAPNQRVPGPGRPPIPAAPSSHRPRPADLVHLVDRLLAIPEVASPAGWTRLLDLLPSELVQIVPRQSPHRLEGIALMRACANYPGGWSDLALALSLIAPPSSARQFVDGVHQLGLVVDDTPTTARARESGTRGKDVPGS